MLETDSLNQPTVSYVLGGTQILSQTKTATTTYLLPDGQGSTRLLTDNAADVTASFAYTAFGELRDASDDAFTGTPATNYLYTGQQYDAATKLYSLRARYYAPGAGRFLSRDTWAYDFQNPVELNRYGYAMGNPINWSDPSGYSTTALETSGLMRTSMHVLGSLRQYTKYVVLLYVVSLYVIELVQEIAERTPVLEKWIEDNLPIELPIGDPTQNPDDNPGPGRKWECCPFPPPGEDNSATGPLIAILGPGSNVGEVVNIIAHHLLQNPNSRFVVIEESPTMSMFIEEDVPTLVDLSIGDRFRVIVGEPGTVDLGADSGQVDYIYTIRPNDSMIGKQSISRFTENNLKIGGTIYAAVLDFDDHALLHSQLSRFIPAVAYSRISDENLVNGHNHVGIPFPHDPRIPSNYGSYAHEIYGTR